MKQITDRNSKHLSDCTEDDQELIVEMAKLAALMLERVTEAKLFWRGKNCESGITAYINTRLKIR